MASSSPLSRPWSVFSWARKWFISTKNPSRRRVPLWLEQLEDRVTPASISDLGGNLTIYLDNPGENLTIAATSANHYSLTSSTNALFANGLTGASYSGNATTGTLTVSSDTAINIIDHTTGTSVTFANSGAISYAQSMTVDLTNPLSGNVTFLGASTFSNGLAVTTTHGTISDGAAAVINVSSGDLSLATNQSISLLGAVTAPNVATLQANGAITANNAGNQFGTLSLTGNTSLTLTPTASASINAGAGAVTLSVVDVHGDLTLSAGGDITQDFNGITVGGKASFESGGSITLNDSANFGDGDNSIAGAISASVSGANSITLDVVPVAINGVPTITLGTVTLGTGSFTLNDDGTAGSSLITEDPAAGGISSAGAVNVNITTDLFANVRLDTAANDLSGGAGSVTITGSGFFGSTTGDLGLRNTSNAADVSQLNIANFVVNNLVVELDDAAVNVDMAVVATLPFSGIGGFNDVTVTAGGDITQSAGIVVNGNASFTSLTGSVTLSDPTNDFADDISAAVSGANTIQLDNSTTTTTLGKITLGTGALTVNDDDALGSSVITEDPILNGGGISTAGAVFINVVNDPSASVDLSTAANNFSGGAGSVSITGAPTTGDFGFRNTNAAASINQLAFTNFAIDSLTIEFDDSGVSLDVASLNALPLDTPGVFGDLGVNVGGNLTHSAAISVTGALTETAGGSITQAAAGDIVAGTATFSVQGNGGIDLSTDGNNSVSSAVSFNTPSGGTGNIAFVNSGSVVLGSSSFGHGAFSITGGAGNITQSFSSTITQAGTGAVTFSAGGTTIDLSTGSQNIFQGPITFSGAAVTTVGLENANPAATLFNPGLATLTSLTLVYDGPVSSILLPTTNINYSLSLTEAGNIVLAAGASFTVTGAHDLSLESLSGNLNLLGSIIDASGTTTLAADSSSAIIKATNTANQFGTLDVNGSAASITIATGSALTLGNSTLSGFGTFAVTAPSIAQAASTSLILTTEAVSLTATTGGITLNNTGNSFAAAISASVTGGNSISVANSNDTTIVGTITLGTGTLSLTDNANSGFSTIQETGNGVSTSGAINITITNDAAVDIDLSTAPNNLGASSVLTITGIGGGTSGLLGVRDVNPAADLSQLALSLFTPTSLTLRVDNGTINAGALPAISAGGDLRLTAGGSITQTGAPLATSGTANFTVLGDGSITLNNVANNLAGLISFAAPNADNKQQISLTNHGDINLDASQLGLASFTLTASANLPTTPGDILATAAITQRSGGGPITLNAAGSTISLDPANGNFFSGPVTFHGTGASNLTTIAFENDNPLATLPTLSGLAASLDSVRFALPSAPVLLPALPSMATLTVNAGGNITQSAALTVTDEAFITTGSYGIQLNNAANNIAAVSLNNSGQNAVTLTTTGALMLDDSILGDGALLISANGPITQTGGAAGLQQVLGPNDAIAGMVDLSGGANPILLNNPSNAIVGPVFLNATGPTGNITLVNSGSLILGQCNAQTFSITAASGSITQAPGSQFQIQGNAYLAAADAIDLTNASNNLVNGLISLNAATAALRLASSAQLDTATVTGGPLNVTAGGAITQSTGLLSAQGANFIVAQPTGANITLAATDFNDLPVTLRAGSGTVSIADSDAGGLDLGNVAFGSGGLSVTAAGPVTQQAGSAVIGNGPVAISNASVAPADAFSVTLDQPGNNVSGVGSFTLGNISNLTLVNLGNIALSGTFGLATALDDGDVNLTAGGAVTLPSGTLNVGSLTISANQTTIAANVTSSDATGLHITGAVAFTTAAILDVTAGGTLSFNGNVTANQALTIDLPANGQINFNNGTWNQGANALTINGPQAIFNINSNATFSMTANTLTMTGVDPASGAPSAQNRINVLGTFQVGGGVNISDGGSDSILDLVIFGILQVLLGTTPGKLTLTGLNAGNQVQVFGSLSGYGGTAPAGSSTVLSVNNGGSIVGTFSNPQDAAGNFLMGTDIVQGTYTDNSLAIQPTAAGTATVSGNMLTGDGYKVALTGGSNMVVIAPGGTELDIVVRTGTAATTLTITTTLNGGTGFVNVGGIAIDGAGPATINAAKANLHGNIVLTGPLTALTMHDWTGGALSAAGSPTQSTTITGNVFDNDTINLGSKLNMLTVAAFTGSTPGSSITAASFGTVKATGNALSHTPGNFSANLINTNTSIAQALTTATIAGTLSGSWELAGSVGTVNATGGTSNFNLGISGGANVANGGKLTNVTTLTLGAAANFNLFATGKVGALTAASIVDSNGLIQANAFTTIKTTGNAATADHGDFLANLTATGNAGGTTKQAIGTLSIAGNLGQGATPMTLLAQNGNIGTITVGRAVAAGVSIDTGGAITSITDGAWQGATLDAQSVGTWKSVGNLPAHLFGSFTGNVTLTGTGSGTAVTLGAFSTTGDLTGNFTIDNGGVTSFTVAGAMTQTDINLQSSAAGIGTIMAAEWTSDTVVARSIGTLKSTGRASTAATPALNGDILTSNITAFLATGAAPSIGTVSVAGSLSNGGSGNYFILANNGITTLSAGRDVTNEQIVTSNGGLTTPGIGTVTAGAWINSDLQAYKLGSMTIKGYVTPEAAGGLVPGSVQNSDFVVYGNNGPSKPGITTMSIAGSLTDDSFNVPFSIGALTVTGLVQSDTIDLRGPSGTLTTFTAGAADQLTLYANSAGTVKTTGNASLGLNGDVTQSTLSISGFTGASTAPVSLATLSIAGNLDQSTVDVKDGITTFTVAQNVENGSIAAAYDLPGATLKTLKAGRWSNTDLAANSIGAFSVTGNASISLAGDVIQSDITLLRSLAGVALGTFTAAGHVNQAIFQITSGNVTSFTVAYFIGSSLYVGYQVVDPTDVFNDAPNDQQAENWQGTFLLGTFKTTAVFNSADVPDTAGFQTSTIVAAKLGAITLSGLNSTPLADSGITTFGVFSRHTGGAAGKLIVTGVHKPSPTTIGSFHYFDLGG